MAGYCEPFVSFCSLLLYTCITSDLLLLPVLESDCSIFGMQSTVCFFLLLLRIDGSCSCSRMTADQGHAGSHLTLHLGTATAQQMYRAGQCRGGAAVPRARWSPIQTWLGYCCVKELKGRYRGGAGAAGLSGSRPVISGSADFSWGVPPSLHVPTSCGIWPNSGLFNVKPPPPRDNSAHPNQLGNVDPLVVLVGLVDTPWADHHGRFHTPS